MRALALALAACGLLACSSKGASFEGAKLVSDASLSPIPNDKKGAKFLDKTPPTRAPFTVTTSGRKDWMLGEGLFVTIWHDSGEGSGAEVREAIAKERKPPAVALPAVAGLRDVDELSETANYLFWKRHTTMHGGIGINERYILAKADDGTLHRWSAGCMDILQEGRCPPLLDTFTLEKAASFTPP